MSKFRCMAVDITSSALQSAAKSNNPHYQYEVSFSVSVINRRMQII